MRFAALAGSVAVCILAVVAAVTLGGVGFIVVAVIFGASRSWGSTTWPSGAIRSCATTRSSGTRGSCWRPSGPSCSSTSSSATTTAGRSTATRRTSIYERAKGIKDEQAYGTERDVREPGYEWLLHSIAPVRPARGAPRGHASAARTAPSRTRWRCSTSRRCGSARSPAQALTALNRGAAKGGFAHDTGEGGLTEYHLNGGDVVWEIGSGYFGARTKDGDFDREQFRDKAAHDAVKCVSLKLSQGAKPGIGGVLPGRQGDQGDRRRAQRARRARSASARPPTRCSRTPRELVRFIAEMRELAGGKPTGFKLCVGSRHELLAICKAMVDEGITPDFIVVDGSEGGTGAAPLRVRGPRRARR